MTPKKAMPKALGVWFKDLNRWSVDSFRNVAWAWPDEVLVRLGDVLRQRRVEVDNDADLATVPIIEKISFGGSISLLPDHRRTGYKGRLFWAKVGDLIYSKIRVKQGSFAVVPEDVERLAVSSEYPVFELETGRMNARFLELTLRSERFLTLLEGLAHGGSTKTRIPVDVFLEQTIPLPALDQQDAIVSIWERAQSELVGMRGEIARLESRIEAEFLAALGIEEPPHSTMPKAFAVRWPDLERWSVVFNQLATVSLDFSSGAYPITTLGEVAKVSYGIQKSPANRPANNPRPYLRVANVRRGWLDLSEIKTINVADEEMNAARLETGDLLFVEGNGSRGELGRCAIWTGEIKDCVHQNHILKVRPDQSRILPKYAMTWFNTRAGRHHFFRNVKTSSGLGTINSTELRLAPIPLAPMQTQERLIRAIQRHRDRIDEIKDQSTRLARESQANLENAILGRKEASMKRATLPLSRETMDARQMG